MAEFVSVTNNDGSYLFAHYTQFVVAKNAVGRVVICCHGATIDVDDNLAKEFIKRLSTCAFAAEKPKSIMAKLKQWFT